MIEYVLADDDGDDVLIRRADVAELGFDLYRHSVFSTAVGEGYENVDDLWGEFTIVRRCELKPSVDPSRLCTDPHNF